MSEQLFATGDAVVFATLYLMMGAAVVSANMSKIGTPRALALILVFWPAVIGWSLGEFTYTIMKALWSNEWPDND